MDRPNLTQSAFKCNGVYFEDVVPGYRTLNTSGRYLLEKELNTKENERADGSILAFSKFPEREIEVEYFITAANWEEFQERYLILSQYLNVENAQIIFNGEPDKYITGTIVAPSAVETAQFERSGTYKIVCNDPFKYSLTEHVVEPSAGVWSIDYKGTYKAFPKFVIDFPKTVDADGNNTNTSECGFVGLVSQNGAELQFGDPEETDEGQIENPATNPFNKTFETATSASDMTLNGTEVLSGQTQTGSVAVNTTDKYLYPSNYGNVSGFHGPSISTILTDVTDATNFEFSWKQKFAATKKQYGCFSVLLYNNNSGTRKLIAGIDYRKTTNDKKVALYFYAGENTKSLTGSKRVNATAIGSSSITKEDGTITFKTAKKTVTLQLDDPTLQVNEIAFFFGQNGSKTALGTNALYEASLTRFSYSSIGNVPNLFMPGDVLTIETKDAGVFLDSGDGTTPMQSIGALGNDWEDFVLIPGLNMLEIVFSDWIKTQPDVQMIYRDVYL